MDFTRRQRRFQWDLFNNPQVVVSGQCHRTHTHTHTQTHSYRQDDGWGSWQPAVVKLGLESRGVFVAPTLFPITSVYIIDPQILSSISHPSYTIGRTSVELHWMFNFFVISRVNQHFIRQTKCLILAPPLTLFHFYPFIHSLLFPFHARLRLGALRVKCCTLHTYL